MNNLFVRQNAIGVVVLVGLTIFNVLRAMNLDITHDEARVYYTFVVNGFRSAFITYSEANHTLQTFIAILTTRLFGLSLLSLRLGSLFGSILYVIACIRLSRLVTRGSVFFTLTLLALTINPLVLDFAVLARGYSLALAFFAAALAVALTTISRSTPNNSPPTPDPRPLTPGPRPLLLISCLCSLSVLSNLSFAFANMSLLIAFAAWLFFQLRKDSTSQWKGSLIALIAPGALLYILINPAIIRFDPSSLYYGSDSWRAYHGNLVSIVFQYTIPIRGLNRLIYLPAFLCMFAAIYAGVIVYSRLRQNERMWDDAKDLKHWFFLSAVMALTVAIHGMFHAFGGGLLPMDRTGLFLIPLGTIVIASSLDGLSHSVIGRKFSHVGKLAFAVLVLVFIVSLRFSWVAVWKFDACSTEVYSFVGTYCSEHRIEKIGVDWYLKPGLVFNGMLRQAGGFPQMRDLFPESEAKAESLFVIGYRDSPTIQRERLAVIYEHPISGVVVALRTE